MTNQPLEEKWKRDLSRLAIKYGTGTEIRGRCEIYEIKELTAFNENLLEQERKRLAKRIIKDDVTCPKAYGFEGRDTFHACEKCVVCELRSIINK